MAEVAAEKNDVLGNKGKPDSKPTFFKLLMFKETGFCADFQFSRNLLIRTDKAGLSVIDCAQTRVNSPENSQYY